MKKRVVAVLLAAVTAAGLLAGCGGTGGSGEGGGSETTEEGKVINIYSWNDEWCFLFPFLRRYPQNRSSITANWAQVAVHWGSSRPSLVP